MDSTGKYLFIFVSVLSNVVHLGAVTVNPSLCPTNKIAPHRRVASWEQSRPRTFGLINGILGPGRPQSDPLNDLQEQPQEDEDDCGEIDDYDETDLSSVTPVGQRRKEDRYFYGSNSYPSYYPGARPPYRPQRPTRPPYNFEGNYGPNGYRPPSNYYPSDYIKPVQENSPDHPQEAYRPGLIGGNVGQIVGFPFVRVTTEAPQKNPNPFRFPINDSYPNRRQKKSQQTNKSTSIMDLSWTCFSINNRLDTLFYFLSLYFSNISPSNY